MSEYRKKLIEVALPLKAINEASAREKSIRHGHPSTLHLWWARRPLAACRAVLFASLVNDPSDDPMYGVSEDIAASERGKLFNLIEELVQWDNSNNPRVINAARAEIARSIAANRVADGAWKNEQVVVKAEGKAATAHDFKHKLASPPQVNAFLAEHAPPVNDPFCGGGSIPLEAQRLGLRAFASDLNPIPVLITKALIEIPPKFSGRPPANLEWRAKPKSEKAAMVWQGAQGLAQDVRHYGQWMRHEAENRIGKLYPKVKITKAMIKERPDLQEYVGQELTVVAWLWARTVVSPDPSCGGALVPIIKSFCLSNRGKENVWAVPDVDRSHNSYSFHISSSMTTDQPTGTVNRRGVVCLLSGTPIPFEYVRTQGKAGRLGIRQLAIIAEANGRRIYLAPSTEQEQCPNPVTPASYPETEMAHNPFSLRPPLYGFRRFADLFTTRQLQALGTFSSLVSDVHKQVAATDEPYADAIATYLSFAISKCSDYWNSIATWMPRGTVGHAFSKQAIPMTWDFPEANPFANFHCSWIEAVEWVAKVIDSNTLNVLPGTVRQLDATADDRSGETFLFSTDPPYYNNIDYADLSDFFYVWLRQSLSRVYPTLFSTIATPKSRELVATPYRFGGQLIEAKRFFEEGLSRTFVKINGSQQNEYPVSVFYAFKQTESETSDDDHGVAEAISSTGWETMLEGLIRAELVVDGTWPMRTERTARTMSIGMNALASSVVLVCRRRNKDAQLATRKQFMNALRQELPLALRNLQHGNVAPVDLAQAAIGPAMGVFTQYAKVVESDGSSMTVRTALGIINQVLDEVLAEQEGDFDPDTRWALAWFDQFGTSEGQFGVAETLSRAKNTAINGLVEAGVVKAKSGKVQLVSRAELPEDWNPATDNRLTVWETTQHLIRTLETKGEREAATLLNRLGGIGETARDLAYRLYSICERKKWAEEALAYNGLVIAWPELTKLALSTRNRQPSTQQDLFS